MFNNKHLPHSLITTIFVEQLKIKKMDKLIELGASLVILTILLVIAYYTDYGSNRRR
jgi:hypothetical protein